MHKEKLEDPPQQSLQLPTTQQILSGSELEKAVEQSIGIIHQTGSAGIT